MNWIKLRTVVGFILLALFVALPLAAIACTPSEAELIEGILQNVDAINGEITITTEDGKTVTLTIASEAPVETEGASSALEALEAGVSVEVEVDEDGQVVQHIEARQAKVKGTIVEIEGNEVTVESKRGRRATVLVTDRTRITLEDHFPGTLADLRLGAEVHIKFDPESRVAFRIDTKEEEAKIEGVVVEVDDDEVTIETERGRRLTLLVDNRTRIELEDDFPGTLADLQVGIKVKVKFDPFTRTAYKIEVKEEEAEIEGVVIEVVGNEVTIETERGRRLTLLVDDRTRIELEDDFPGTLADLQVGVKVEAKFDPVTRRAFKVEVKEAGGIPPLPVAMGMIEVRVTDPPPPDMDHIWVEIRNLEVHKDGGPWTTIAVEAEPFDLKAIEGIEEFLASQVVEAGKYTQLRLDTETVTVVVGEDEHDATVPSGKIKLVRPFEVKENETTVITLDFDGKKSVLVTGKGKYIFKPVIKLLVSATADTTPPTVVSTSPEDNASDVAITTVVSATFSEAMDEATITAGSFTLSDGGSVAGTVSYDAGTLTATFTPDSNLAHSTVYTATITTAVTDAAGDALQADYAWSFTTTADTTPPTVVSTSPEDNASDVAITTVVSATFSEAMDEATITAGSFTLSDGGSVAGTVSYDAGTLTATFTPDASLAHNTAYTATITTAVTDAAGDALQADYAWSFTTTADTTPPTVVSTHPVDGATNAAITTAVSATFSEAMDEATITAASFTLSDGGAVAGIVSYDAGTLTATFTPDASLEYSTVYTATITTTVTDVAGNHLAADYAWSFTTMPDTTPPTVVSTHPVDGATNAAITTAVSATFSEAMDEATITTGSFTLSDGGPVAGTVSYDAGTLTATFTPDANLAHSTVYTATITTAVTDVAGNHLAADYVWSFTTTAETTPPTVVSTHPVDGATNAAITTAVSATFSEAMDAATITTSSFTLSDGGPVTGTVSYDAGTLTATFTPDANLEYSTPYTATITTAVTDVTGNHLAADYVWSFTTTAETTPPTVVSTHPVDGATNAAITTAVSATFSEAMDEATITTGSFTLSDGGAVAGIVSYDAGTLTATFTPDANLAHSTVYTATITTAVTDAAGNALQADYVWSFTTEGP